MALSANKIRAAVTKAFQVTGDLRQTVIYSNVVPGDYDPATGLTNDSKDDYTFLAPVVRADEKEQAAFPAVNNVQVILADYASLPDFTPHPADYITIGGVRWEILRLRTAPGRAVTRIYVGTP